MPEFLLEIGCEELPAAWLPGLTEQLARRLEEAAAGEHLEPAGVRSCSTPRRLIVRADLLGRQPDRDERAWGPSLKVARDAAGAWTGAANGFAKKSGVPVDQLQQGAKDAAAPDELYLFSVRKTAGRPSRDVLSSGVVPSLLRALAFPKRMNWDAMLLDERKGAFPFGRPIRWLVAVLDGDLVPIAIHDQHSGPSVPPIV